MNKKTNERKWRRESITGKGNEGSGNAREDEAVRVNGIGKREAEVQFIFCFPRRSQYS